MVGATTRCNRCWSNSKCFMSRINVMKPWLGADEVAAVTSAIESGWIAQGPRVAEFESAFAHAMATKHAVALSNCTTERIDRPGSVWPTRADLALIICGNCMVHGYLVFLSSVT